MNKCFLQKVLGRWVFIKRLQFLFELSHFPLKNASHVITLPFELIRTIIEIEQGTAIFVDAKAILVFNCKLM